MTVEHVLRWQYLYEAKQAFDKTPPGWHSFGTREAGILESQYQAKSEAPATIKAASSGYVYSVDVHHMTQRNRSTGKIRKLRRLELPLRRVVVQGGSKFKMDVELGEGETVEWFFEVQGRSNIDMRVCFVPSEGGPATSVYSATWHSVAGDYVAPRAGLVRIVWENYYTLAAPRVLLLHCQPSSSSGAGGSEGQHEASDATVPEFIGEPAGQDSDGGSIPEVTTAAVPEERSEAAPARDAAGQVRQEGDSGGAAAVSEAKAEVEREADAEAGAEDGEESFSDWEVIPFDDAIAPST